MVISGKTNKSGWKFPIPKQMKRQSGIRVTYGYTFSLVDISVHVSVCTYVCVTGLLVDSEIVLSTRYGKSMVFINKPLSTETSYQQDLINRDLLSTRLIVGKLGSGMWCGKFNSTSNVLVCETQRKVNMYGCVSQ